MPTSNDENEILMKFDKNRCSWEAKNRQKNG